MDTESFDISRLRPYRQNNRKRGPEQIKRIAKSIKQFGFNQPIVVDENDEILVGHGRHEAALSLGLDTVPVLRREGLTEQQKRAYRILDNKLQNESEWEFGNLKLEIDWLEEDGFDIDAWDLNDLRLDLGDEEVEEDDYQLSDTIETDIKRGDLIELGRHRVLCADCTKLDQVERVMNKRLADLLLTDPPYGVDYAGGSKKRAKLENDDAEILPFYTDVFTNALCVSKKGASAYVWHASLETHNAISAFIKSGWEYKQYIVWNKDNSTFGRSDYHWKHEPCLYGWAKGGSHNWYGDRKQTTVWEVKRPSRSDEHSTMKPVDLFARSIKFSSKQDDIVLDLFLGSGTTLVASEQLGRICYGTEIEPRYCEAIIERYKALCQKDGKEFTCKVNGQDYDPSKKKAGETPVGTDEGRAAAS